MLNCGVAAYADAVAATLTRCGRGIQRPPGAGIRILVGADGVVYVSVTVVYTLATVLIAHHPVVSARGVILDGEILPAVVNVVAGRGLAQAEIGIAGDTVPDSVDDRRADRARVTADVCRVVTRIHDIGHRMCARLEIDDSVVHLIGAGSG